MSIDLESMTRQQLIALRNDVEKALSSVAERERRAAMEAIQRAAAEHGFSLTELTGVELPKSRGRKSGAPAKYRNPEDDTQTWSGRGRRPEWVNAALAAGKGLEDLAV